MFLLNKLREALKQRRWYVVFCFNRKVHQHTPQVKHFKKIHDSGFELLDNQPYSPIWLALTIVSFYNWKELLKRRTVKSGSEVIAATEARLEVWHSEFFLQGLERLATVIDIECPAGKLRDKEE